MLKIPIAKDVLPYLLILGVCTVIVYLFLPFLAILPLAVLLFVLFFFRDPPRHIQMGDNLILAPADGRITEIKEVYEERYLKERAIKISIFLSLFNVHINRSPINGSVRYRDYREGKFIPAFKSHASELNEKNFVGIENERLKVLVNQVTGFVARRIVCWVREGDSIQQGERFGMIKFGSCTEIFVPLSVEVLVEVGQKTKGGETVIGRIKENDT